VSVAARKIRLLMELRRGGLIDTRVLAAIERTPRELFVPETFQDQAYEDQALPIGRGQTISQPLVVGLMTQALEVGERMKVLEIGTGSGYQAAILARLCRRLYTIERHKPLLKEALERFKALRLHNITAIAGDGMKGWPEQAPFDRIMVTAAATEIPQALVDQLDVGGILVIPVGADGFAQDLIKLVKTETGVTTESFLPVRFVPLLPGLAEE
jgi:protein-L-isoaspartate(D-aspartate) O-methyltransferase